MLGFLGGEEAAAGAAAVAAPFSVGPLRA